MRASPSARALLVFVFCAVGTACRGPMGGGEPTSSSDAAPTASAAGPHSGMSGMSGMMAMCPMQLPGVHVTAADTADGAAMVFTTTMANVEEVRQRVRHMAAMRNMHQGGMMHAQGGGPGGGCPMMGGADGAMRMPNAQSRAEDVADGEQIVFVPTAPAEIDAVRAHVRAHAALMQSGQCCSMMGSHAASDAPGPASGEAQGTSDHSSHHPEP